MISCSEILTTRKRWGSISIFVTREREPRRASYPRSRGIGRFVPSQPRAALVSSFEPTSGMRLLCQTFSRKASFPARRTTNSLRVSTV